MNDYLQAADRSGIVFDRSVGRVNDCHRLGCVPRCTAGINPTARSGPYQIVTFVDFSSFKQTGITPPPPQSFHAKTNAGLTIPIWKRRGSLAGDRGLDGRSFRSQWLAPGESRVARSNRLHVTAPAGAVCRPRLLLAAVACFALGGCATAPYQYGRFHPQSPDGTELQPIVIEYGKPHKTLDRIGWVVGTPARLLTLNRKTDNHKISSETVEKLRKYLEENDITDVYVAVNDYDPKGQWKRLRENDRMSPVWRYSMGTLTWIGYTLLPNRIFGGDKYNPYTNSLNLSSDVPALVLAEAAYAKDIHSQRHPGAYAAFVNDLPVLSVFRQAKATSDVLGYARVEGDWKTEQQAYHVLYPRIGSATVGTAAPFVPVVGPFMGLGGAVAGHAAGRTVAYVQKSKLPQPLPEEPPDENPSPAGEAGPQTELAEDEQPWGPSPQAGEESGIIQAGHEESANRPHNETRSPDGGIR